MRILRSIIGCTAVCLCSAFAGDAPAIPTADGKTEPKFIFLEPGFTVKELPLKLTNIDNVEYAPDGRLFAVGYDGRVYLLSDTDNDGLEDSSKVFFQGKGDYDSPLGVQFRDGALYVTLRGRIEKFVDTDGDGVADKNEAVATGWFDPETKVDKTFKHRRVDDAMALAIDAEGRFYTMLGTPNYENLYQLGEDKKPHYRRDRYRGAVLRVPPGGKPEIIATGVRFLVSMQFNRHGDLFATDQEGATWGPGNPFDELLYIQKDRHYGFPPRHPEYLPDVIDEQAVVDFAPQHQSTCGFRFNETKPGFKRFGPADWEDNAIVTGMSRGKLWRVPLAKTNGGYVGKPVLIGSVNLLPVDCTISPKGDLVVCCHSGKPDWGSGPRGIGVLYKISYTAPKEPRVAAVWPETLTEVRAAFSDEIPSDAVFESEIFGGRYVRAGDIYETFRPGYNVIAKEERPAPRHRVVVNSAKLSSDRREVALTTAPHPWQCNYSLMLRWKSASTGRSGEVHADYDFNGVRATWTTQGEQQPSWSGWLPHPNLDVARAMTLGSATHDSLFEKLKAAGTLALTSNIAPAAKPLPFTVSMSQVGVVSLGERKTTATGEPLTLTVPAGNDPQSLTLTMIPGGGVAPKLALTANATSEVNEHPFERNKLVLSYAPALQAPSAPAKPKDGTQFVRGDAVNGKTHFEKNCMVCHTFNGQGGKVGPNLSNSPERDPFAIKQDIVEPSAALNPDHLGFLVKLKDGQVLNGVVTANGPDAFSVWQATGVAVDVKQADIKSMTQLKESLMPTGFDKLGEDVLRDIITYLTTPLAK